MSIGPLFDAGYRAGYEAGKAAGYREGLEAAAKALEDAELVEWIAVRRIIRALLQTEAQATRKEGT